MNVIGNKKTLEYIRDAVKSDRVLGAYIIEGASGSGKTLIARYFAASALCPESGGEPCMTCPVCTRIFEGIHPDVAEIGGDDAQIPVDTVREAVLSAQLTPTESDRKFYIIRRAHNMTAQAQNALLKGIEEPPRNVTYILLTDDITLLLPTVISRCFRLKTEALSTEDTEKALKSDTDLENASEEDLHFAAVVSAGSIGKAKKLIYDDDIRAAKSDAENYLREFIKKSSPAARSAYLPSGAKRDAFFLRVQMINMAVRDVLVRGCGANGAEMTLFTDPAAVEKLAGRCEKKSLVKLFDATCEMLLPVNKNANVTAAASYLNNIS